MNSRSMEPWQCPQEGQVLPVTKHTKMETPQIHKNFKPRMSASHE